MAVTAIHEIIINTAYYLIFNRQTLRSIWLSFHGHINLSLLNTSFSALPLDQLHIFSNFTHGKSILLSLF